MAIRNPIRQSVTCRRRRESGSLLLLPFCRRNFFSASEGGKGSKAKSANQRDTEGRERLLRFHLQTSNYPVVVLCLRHFCVRLVCFRIASLSILTTILTTTAFLLRRSPRHERVRLRRSSTRRRAERRALQPIRETTPATGDRTTDTSHHKHHVVLTKWRRGGPGQAP